jgi:hypothetical protein
MAQQITDLVKIGSHVEVELLSAAGETERLAFDLVRDAAADFAAGFLGASTPLGRALVGRPSGVTVPYRVADVVAARIVSVTESERTPDAGASAARQMAAREAVARHDREEMARLSLTFSSKWGEWEAVEGSG